VTKAGRWTHLPNMESPRILFERLIPTQETAPSGAAALPYHNAESYKFWLNKITCERLGYKELSARIP